MSSPYFDFAQIYDACMDDIPYEAWAGFLKRQFDEYGIGPSALVLDLGCGTGTFTLLLRDLGYDMIGADISESMLEVAREKYYECLESEEESGNTKAPVLFLQQDMRSFELYGTVGRSRSVYIRTAVLPAPNQSAFSDPHQGRICRSAYTDSFAAYRSLGQKRLHDDKKSFLFSVVPYETSPKVKIPKKWCLRNTLNVV